MKDKENIKKKEKKPVAKWKIILAAVLVMIILADILYYNITKNMITAHEWFNREMEYIIKAKALSEQMDFTVTLYLNDNINEESYLMQMKTVQDEYLMFVADRDRDYSQYKIKLDSYTRANKMGIESAEASYNILGNLVYDCTNPDIYTDKDQLSYMYLAYMDELASELSKVSECASMELYEGEE